MTAYLLRDHSTRRVLADTNHEAKVRRILRDALSVGPLPTPLPLVLTIRDGDTHTILDGERLLEWVKEGIG